MFRVTWPTAYLFTGRTAAGPPQGNICVCHGGGVPLPRLTSPLPSAPLTRTQVLRVCSVRFAVWRRRARVRGRGGADGPQGARVRELCLARRSDLPAAWQRVRGGEEEIGVRIWVEGRSVLLLC